MVDVYTLFDNFFAATTFKGILQSFQHICTALDLDPTDAPNVYKHLRQVNDWKTQKLWKLLDKKYEQAEYRKQTVGEKLNVLIIGAGPCGLRMAIECALLGCHVNLVEQRDKFSRNNVLHLWEFVIHDLKALGAKIFYPKFCTGSIEHISIRQLQCILLKVSLVLGVQVFEGISYIDLNLPKKRSDGTVSGYRPILDPMDHMLCDFDIDVLIGADGKRNTVKGFPREEMRGKLAIGITANFVNKKTYAEERVPEISGVAYIFNQAFFKEMYATTGVDLENIVYYKDETHYFVMCAKKQSLLEQRVIMKDFDDVSSLLAPENVDQDQLCRYAAAAANFATSGKLPCLDYETNHRGRPDIAMFDFTSLFSSKCSVRMVERLNKYLLLGIVGDSLHEPFWPTGSGCARGFLGVLDTAWSIREYGLNKRGPLEIIAERESIYRLLAQVTKDNLHKQMTKFSIDPRTRYVSLEMSVRADDVFEYVDSDNPRFVDVEQPIHLRLPSTVTAHDHPHRMKYAIWRFCYYALAPYKLKLINMDSSWRDGRALAALLAKFRPESIDYFAIIGEETLTTRLRKVFECVSESLNVEPPCRSFEWEELEGERKLAYIGHIVGSIRSDSDRVQKVLITPRSAASKRNLGKRNVDASKAKKSEPIQKLSAAISDLYGQNKAIGHQYTPLSVRKRTNSEGLREFAPLIFDAEERGRKRSGTTPEEEPTTIRKREVDRLNPDLVQKVSRIVSGDIWNDQSQQRREERDRQLANRKNDKNNGDSDVVEGRGERMGVMSSQDEKMIRAVASDARREAMNGFTREQEREKFKDIDSTIQKSDEAHRRRELTGVDAVSRWRKLLDERDTVPKNGTGLPPAVPQKTMVVESRTMDGNVVIRPVAPVQPKRQAQSMPMVESLYDSVNPRQEKCQMCKKAVYLAERMQVESMFVHKSCFKCAYCSHPLRLGEYGHDREVEHHYKNKFFCKTHLRLSLREKIVRIQRNEAKLEKRNSQDEGSASDSSKENVDPPLSINNTVSKTPSGSTIVSTLGGTVDQPVIRIPKRSTETSLQPQKSTLNFFNPEQLRESTFQRIRERRESLLTSPVGDGPPMEATPERAEFQPGIRKASSVVPSEVAPLDFNVSDSEDEEEEIAVDEGSPGTSEESGASTSKENSEGDESFSDEEEELLAEEDLQELEKTVLEIDDEHPENEITDDLALSVLERINSRRSEIFVPIPQRTNVMTTPLSSSSSARDRFFTPPSSLTSMPPPSRRPMLSTKSYSEDAGDVFVTPKMNVREGLEQMRSAARERAKLKSDEELGLGSRSLSVVADRRSVPVESMLSQMSVGVRSSTVSPPRDRERFEKPALPAQKRVEQQMEETTKPRAWSMLDNMPSMRRDSSPPSGSYSTQTDNYSTPPPPPPPTTVPPSIGQPLQQSQGLLSRLFSPDLSRRTIVSHPSSNHPPSLTTTTTPPPALSSSHTLSSSPPLSSAHTLSSSSPSNRLTPSTHESVHCESAKERSLRGKANIWNKLKMRKTPPDSPVTTAKSSAPHDSPRSNNTDAMSVCLNSDLPCAAVAPSPRIVTDRLTVAAPTPPPSAQLTASNKNIRMIQKKIEKLRRQHDEDKRRSAQDIQRGLQETEIRIEYVEKRGTEVEERLYKDPRNLHLLDEWSCLVSERDILRLKEEDLRQRAKEMELENRYKSLHARFRDFSADVVDDSREDILREMLSVIDEKKEVQKAMDESRKKHRRPRERETQVERAGHDYRNCTPVFATVSHC